MPILYQILISVIISVFWSSQAIGKISISIETIAAISDFGQTHYHAFSIIMDTEKCNVEKKPRKVFSELENDLGNEVLEQLFSLGKARSTVMC